MSEQQQKSGRRVLLLLIVIFFAPLAIAWMMYFDVISWRPITTTANGEILEPALALQTHEPTYLVRDGQHEFLRRKWHLVFITGTACANDCEQSLLLMRQVRASLGKYSDRIGRVMITAGADEASEELRQAFPGMQIVIKDELTQTILSKTSSEAGAWIFVVDPLGNVIMRYPQEQEPRPMYDDLKRLLKYSRIG